MANTDLVKKKPVALEVATYERLSKLAAQLRIDNPGGGFVSMSTAVAKLLDVFNTLENIQAFSKTLGEADELRGKAFVLIPFWDEDRIDICTPSYRVESSPDQWDVVGSFLVGKRKKGECSGFCGLNYCDENGCVEFKPVSIRAYVADVEANEPVIIKQSDGAQYLEKMLAHNHNAYLTPQRDKAMVFDNRDQATAFLRKCGHEVGNWIIEPV